MMIEKIMTSMMMYLEQIRWHKGFLFPVIHDSLLA